MQKRRLGISLYPERSTFEQDVAYLEKAAKLGFDLLFIALLGAGDRQQTIDRYKPLLAKAKELGFEIEADVNPMMFERMGINATLQSIDFGRLRDFRVSTVETMTKGLTGLLAHRGVTVFRGCAALQNAHTVRVTPAEGETQVSRSVEAGVFEPVETELAIDASCWQPDRVRLRCLEIRSPAR